ncbi:MAG: Uma2 family endonuclease [Roseofilum sp. Guam]|nr:Uma2 family endonuclease [Roseofilum sp. Guam]MBP0029408.1 Uma2 family endonuclease [Roseofilum sp. Guam]
MVAAMTKQSAVEEYLEQENRNIDKSEFIQGEIIKMAGASANHNRLTLNLSRLLPLEVGDRNYEVFMSDMRLWLPVSESYVYPDVMAIAEEPMFTDSKQMALTNPCLIAEVLSSSTEGLDKNQKFALYRSIPQLQEYLLIDQFSYRVELYRKVGDHQWLLTELIGEDTIVELQSVNLTIKLSELYKRVQFEQSEE